MGQHVVSHLPFKPVPFGIEQVVVLSRFVIPPPFPWLFHHFRFFASGLQRHSTPPGTLVLLGGSNLTHLPHFTHILDFLLFCVLYHSILACSLSFPHHLCPFLTSTHTVKNLFLFLLFTFLNPQKYGIYGFCFVFWNVDLPLVYQYNFSPSLPLSYMNILFIPSTHAQRIKIVFLKNICDNNLNQRILQYLSIHIRMNKSLLVLCLLRLLINLID